MKKLLAIWIAGVLLFGLFACMQKDVGKAAEGDPHPAETANGHKHTLEHKVYTDDYPTLYANELGAIFGDYTLGERMECHEDGWECGCGLYEDETDWYEWEITYRDACGQTMTCTLNNMSSIYRQQIKWLEEQTEEHFWSNYVVRYFDGLMDPDSFGLGSYCFCFIGEISGWWHDEETRAYQEIGDQYRENLQKCTDPIPMHALSYPEIFDRYPIRLSVNVRLSEDGVEEAEWPERFATAKVLLDQMVAEITEEIGNELNLEATVGRNRLDTDQSTRFYTVHILRGKPYEYPEDYIAGDFERAIMDSYKGKFW